MMSPCDLVARTSNSSAELVRNALVQIVNAVMAYLCKKDPEPSSVMLSRVAVATMVNGVNSRHKSEFSRRGYFQFGFWLIQLVPDFPFKCGLIPCRTAGWFPNLSFLRQGEE